MKLFSFTRKFLHFIFLVK